MTTTPHPEDRRALAQRARLARAARIRQLRRRVIATALAIFVLATGAVAWDGSMGGEPPTASSAAAASSRILVESAHDPSAADVVTTQQS